MKPGDKVVCVDALVCHKCGGPSGLIENQVYVVKAVHPHYKHPRLVIELIGIQAPCASTHYLNTGRMMAYAQRRFRLLDELKREATTRQTQANPVGIVEPLLPVK